MLSLGFAAAAEDLVLHGPTGRGKTHVDTALGIEATARGIPVRFHQTASLVLQLGKAKREGTLDRLMAEIGRRGLVVLDEFGYVPFDVDGARLLYQVIADSYERRSIAFTTNIEFSRWGTVFADDKLAAAIVDRVVHHGRLVEFGGPSHRLEHALMLGKGDAHEGEAGDGLAGGPRPGGGDRGDGQVPGTRRMEGDQLGRVDRRGRGLPLPGDLRGGDRLRLPGPVEGAAGGASGPPRQAPRGGGFGLPVGRADGRRGGRGSPPRGPYHFGKFSLTKSESSFYHFGNFYLTKYSYAGAGDRTSSFGSEPTNGGDSTGCGVVYEVHTIAHGWLGAVSKCDGTEDGYAGYNGEEVDGVRAYRADGKPLTFQSHVKGGGWLGETVFTGSMDGKNDSGDGYSGDFGHALDAIRVDGCEVRVACGGEYFGWLKDGGTPEGDDFAGDCGRAITAVQMRA